MGKDKKLNFRIHGLDEQFTEDKVTEVFTDILVERMIEKYKELNLYEDEKRVLA